MTYNNRRAGRRKGQSQAGIETHGFYKIENDVYFVYGLWFHRINYKTQISIFLGLVYILSKYVY